MSKAERPTQQLRNHSAHCAQALSPSQLRSPGDNDRRVLLTAGHTCREPQLLTIMSPSQQWQGHRAQLLRCLLSTQGSDTDPKPAPPGPFPSWGNSAATACSYTACRAFPSPKNDQSTLSSAPSQPHLPLTVGQRLVPASATVAGDSPR